MISKSRNTNVQFFQQWRQEDEGCCSGVLNVLKWDLGLQNSFRDSAGGLWASWTTAKGGALLD